MSLSINIIIPFFALLTYGLLYLLVIFSKPISQAQQAFRGYLLAMLLWSLSAFIVLAGLGNALFWFRLMISSAVASMLGIFYFVQKTITKERSWARWVYYYGIFSIAICLFTNWVVHSATVNNGMVYYEFTWLMLVVAGPGYALYVFSMLDVAQAYSHSKDALQRNRLRYLIMGLTVIMLCSFFNWTPLGQYPIDIAANGISALLIAYSILRHRLLDIKLVVRQGLLYSIPTTIIGTAYFLIISLAFNLFHFYTGVQIFILSLIVAIFAAIIARPFYQKAQLWIDQLFFREKYDTNLMIQRFSHTAASLLDLDRLTNMILTEIATNFHIDRIVFFINQHADIQHPENGGDFHLAAQLGIDLAPDFSLRNHHPIALWLNLHDQALTHQNMDIDPVFKALWKKEREDLAIINAEIFIPVKAQNNLIGILALGPKLSGLSYSSDDQLTLTTLANQSAMAIENALHFDAELSRREELDALYSLTRQLLDTDNIDNIMERLVRSVVYNIHVSYAAFLNVDENGKYIHQVDFRLHQSDWNILREKLESDTAQQCYDHVIKQKKLILLVRDELNMSEYLCLHPLINVFQSMCISPLFVGDKNIGLLLLGEVRNLNRESFSADKLRLIDAISDQAASALHRAMLHEQLEENFVQTILALANAMDARDTYTRGHSERLAFLASMTLKELTSDEELIQAINWAAMLHDIGKIGVSDSILLKPGKLTSEEWLIMKQHPEIGGKIIEPVKKLAEVAPLVRSHHEKFDGTGYPNGLKSIDIPLGARVLSVVDAYCAMVDDRVYRKAIPHQQALAELLRCAGTHFDPQVVSAFLIVSERKKN